MIDWEVSGGSSTFFPPKKRAGCKAHPQRCEKSYLKYRSSRPFKALPWRASSWNWIPNTQYTVFNCSYLLQHHKIYKCFPTLFPPKFRLWESVGNALLHGFAPTFQSWDQYFLTVPLIQRLKDCFLRPRFDGARIAVVTEIECLSQLTEVNVHRLLLCCMPVNPVPIFRVCSHKTSLTMV